MLFLISRIIAKKTAEGGVGDARSGDGSDGHRNIDAVRPSVDIAAIERHLSFPKTSGARAFPSTVSMTMTRWS